MDIRRHDPRSPGPGTLLSHDVALVPSHGGAFGGHQALPTISPLVGSTNSSSRAPLLLSASKAAHVLVSLLFCTLCLALRLWFPALAAKAINGGALKCRPV